MAQDVANSRIDGIPAPRRHGRRIMAAAAHRPETRAVSMTGSSQAVNRLRRLALGMVLMALALLAPTLADEGTAQGVAQPLLTENAVPTEALATPATVEDGTTRAPAAFSDALAAAPAGAQCSVQAHSCSVPVSDDAHSTATETTLAYGFSHSVQSGHHNERM